MSVLDKALEELGVEQNYETVVKYSRAFNEYGANIRLYRGVITLKLSVLWRPISEELRIGLAEHLLVSLLKLKKNTMNMDLYQSFVKKIHIGIPKVVPEEKLLESFNRVNEKYFFGMMNIPNIVWGDHSIRKLGSYDYKRDSITISRILEKNETFLDMTMHHELLHKKHKFSSKNGRNLHHSTAFRNDEKLFDDFEETEKALKYYLMKSNLKKLFRLW